jgi:hypothetical protein
MSKNSTIVLICHSQKLLELTVKKHYMPLGYNATAIFFIGLITK